MNDDLIETFQLDSSNLRGRILRVGPALDSLLKRHSSYPDPVTRLTGETACIALMLSSMLKYDGIFTLQLQGDGPVSMVVADITNQGVMRACAKYKKSGEEIFPVSNPLLLMGKGHLAFTVDQGEDMERYQGIVTLSGKNFQDLIQHYFSQSEQITTGIRFAMDKTPDGFWRAGAIILQRLPEQKENSGEAEEDDWRRAMTLLHSCTDKELLDPDLPQNDLLFRLFHEEGVRVYDPVPVRDRCRCSQERAENILRMISSAERQDMAIEGKIVVTCEFCNRQYGFDARDLERKIQDGQAVHS
jgi:molecular chaperone Hsp33